MSPSPKKTSTRSSVGNHDDLNGTHTPKKSVRSPAAPVSGKKTPGGGVQRSRSTIVAMRERTKRKSDVRRSGLKDVTSPVPISKRQKGSPEDKRGEKATDPPEMHEEDNGRPKVYCSTSVPNFKSLWPILQTIGFGYSSSSGYWHPDVSERFPNERALAAFLSQRGIPNVDNLPKEEREELENFAKFAFVPAMDLRSAKSSLGSLKLSHEILPNDQIQKIIRKLGFEFCNENGRKPVILAPGAKARQQKGLPLTKGIHYFMSLEEVRVFIRCRDILSVEDGSGRQLRNSEDPAIKDERSQERLSVRLWAADSMEPLPKFQPDAAVLASPGCASPGQRKVKSRKNSGKHDQGQRTTPVGEQTQENGEVRSRVRIKDEPQELDSEDGQQGKSLPSENGSHQDGRAAATSLSESNEEMLDSAEDGRERTPVQSRHARDNQETEDLQQEVLPDPAMSENIGHDQDQDQVRKYHRLRNDIIHERKLRNIIRVEMKDLPPKKEKEIPETPPDNIANAIVELQMRLKVILRENELHLRQTV